MKHDRWNSPEAQQRAGNEDRDLEKRPEADKLKPLWRTKETLRSLESRLSIGRQNRSRWTTRDDLAGDGEARQGSSSYGRGHLVAKREASNAWEEAEDQEKGQETSS